MAAALLLIFPHSDEGRSFIDGWSWVIFIITLILSARKVNPILLIVLSAIIGIAVYGF
jgi:chromate transporter